MICSILNDAARRPDLFRWTGRISEAEMADWLDSHRLTVPNDLADLWIETGGGEIFESETILSPFGDSSEGSDVESVNRFHLRRGMPEDYFVFHVGLTLSAIRAVDEHYVVLDPETYREMRVYPSFEEWYVNEIRKEYADRYGLPGVRHE